MAATCGLPPSPYNFGYLGRGDPSLLGPLGGIWQTLSRPRQEGHTAAVQGPAPSVESRPREPSGAHRTMTACQRPQREMSDLCEEFALDRHILYLTSLGLDP